MRWPLPQQCGNCGVGVQDEAQATLVGLSAWCSTCAPLGTQSVDLGLDLLGAQGGHASLGDLVSDSEEVLEGLAALLGSEKVDEIGHFSASCRGQRLELSIRPSTAWAFIGSLQLSRG